jgi:hypothetical protein
MTEVQDIYRKSIEERIMGVWSELDRRYRRAWWAPVYRAQVAKNFRDEFWYVCAEFEHAGWTIEHQDGVIGRITIRPSDDIDVPSQHKAIDILDEELSDYGFGGESNEITKFYDDVRKRFVEEL